MDADPHNPTLQADRAALEELRELGMEMARYVIKRSPSAPATPPPCRTTPKLPS